MEFALLTKLSLTAGVLVLIALAAELLLPLLPPHLDAMLSLLQREEAGYTLRPGVELPFSGMFEKVSPPVTWQTNAQGLRAAGPVGAVSDRFRVGSYGDSEAFGVSVALDDTYASRMERLEPRVEVLNFGVPGYNAAEIAARIEATVPLYEPDLVIYLVNKNDTDEPISIGDRVVRSSLLLRLRFLYQIAVTRPARLAARRSPERLAFLADQLDRIAAYTEARGIPLLLVFMKAHTWSGARQNAAAGGFTASAGASGRGRQEVVVVEDLLDPHPKLDDHLGPAAQRALARRLCSRIASGEDAQCVPSGWSPALRTRHAQVGSGSGFRTPRQGANMRSKSSSEKSAPSILSGPT